METSYGIFGDQKIAGTASMLLQPARGQPPHHRIRRQLQQLPPPAPPLHAPPPRRQRLADSTMAIRQLVPLLVWLSLLRVSAYALSNPIRQDLLLRRRTLLSTPPKGAAAGILAAVTFLPQRSSAAAQASAASAASSVSMTPKSTINWGIIGLGDVTAKKSGPAFYKCQGSKLAAVMRRTPGAALAWKNQHVPADLAQSITAYDNLDDFLLHPDLDAVYIATPPGAHKEAALRVAEAGLPCYIEKPVGRCAAETMDVVKAFEKRKIPLFTAYVSRAYERTQAIRQLLKDGVIGDRVTAINYRLRGTGGARGMETNASNLPWRLVAEQSGGGLIMDVGCHVVDRIDYLFGPLIDVNGHADNRCSPSQAVEDYVQLSARIGPVTSDGDTNTSPAIQSEGAVVECKWDFGNIDGLEPVDELIISGPKGKLRMAAMSPSLPVEVLNVGDDVVQTLTFVAPEHAAQPLVQMVTSELRGVGQAPSRGANAIRTSRILDTALSGYYGGREDEFWHREGDWPGQNKGQA